VSIATPGIYKLIDDDNPMTGVSITYENGDFCTESRNYKLIIEARCNKTVAFEPVLRIDYN
jgi:hypothetical protein